MCTQPAGNDRLLITGLIKSIAASSKGVEQVNAVSSQHTDALWPELRYDIGSISFRPCPFVEVSHAMAFAYRVTAAKVQ